MLELQSHACKKQGRLFNSTCLQSVLSSTFLLPSTRLKGSQGPDLPAQLQCSGMQASWPPPSSHGLLSQSPAEHTSFLTGALQTH